MDETNNAVARAYHEVHRLKQQVGHLEARVACLEQERGRLLRIQEMQQRLGGEYFCCWREAQARGLSLEAQVKELEGRLRTPAQDSMQQAG